MKKHVFIVLMSGLVLFGFSGPGNIASVEAQDVEDLDTKLQTPIQEQPHFPMNLCLNSKVIDDSKKVGAVQVQSPELLKVVDGDLSTFLRKECNKQSWVEVKFPYRPRWISQIKIAHGGMVPYVVEYLRLDDYWQVAGTYDSSHVPGSSLHFESFNLKPLQVKAIRWRPVFTEPAEVGISEIYEMEAYFLQVDEDDDGDWEIGVEWCNDYPSPTKDLKYSDDNAQELYDKVGGIGGWRKAFEKGNSFAWESDFKRSGLSGFEWKYIDAVDLSYFSGHGSTDWDYTWNSWRKCLWFGTEHWDGSVVPGDGGRYPSTNSWGDGDLEWLGFTACETMKDWWYWAQCMNGLHLILGWKTIEKDIGPPWSKTFGYWWGKYMRRGQTVTRAWFDADQKTHGWISCFSWLPLPSDYRIPHFFETGVIAEERENFYDYLWGIGYVSPDPIPDGWFEYWSKRVSKRWFAKEAEDEVLSKLLNAPSDPLIILPSKSEKGMPIKYPSSALSLVPETTMVMYNVIQRTVDSVYVQNIANSMCTTESVLCCTAEVESDGEGSLYLTCGSEEIEVSEASGGVEYMNSAWWMVPPSLPPILPSESEAISSANTFLNSIDFLFDDAYVDTVGYFELLRVNKETGEVDTNNSYYTGITVHYQRKIGGDPVVGPGAALNVTYGHGGRLEDWFCGGWRDVAPGPEVSIITAQQAMELITIEGSDATIGGIPFCDTVQVLATALGHYEKSGDIIQSWLEPIWILASLCISEHDTTGAEIYVPARFLPPKGSIDSPADSSFFAKGDTVTFIGSVTSGTPPYIFDWYSDIDGYLGSGNTISTDDLSAICVDSLLSPQTITMIVTDVNEFVDYARISLWIGLRGDADGDCVIDISDVVYLIRYLFEEGPEPIPPEAGESNCDGIIDIADVVYLLNYIFINGPPPCGG